jgi:hypothetical protein
MFGFSVMEIVSAVMSAAVLIIMAAKGVMPLGMIVEMNDETDVEGLNEGDLGLGERPDGADTAGTDLEKGKPEPGTAAGAAEGDGGKGAAPGAGADSVDAGKAGDGAGGPAAGEPAALLAGRFRTHDDLAKGLLEIAKPLKYNEEVLQTALELAKKSGDWASVEKMYNALNKSLSEGKKADAPAAGGKPGAQQDPQNAGKPAAGTQVETDKAVRLFAVRETLDAVVSSNTVQRLTADGYKLPKGFLLNGKVTDEFMDTLRDDGKTIEYLELKELIKKTYGKSVEDGYAFVQAEEESKTHNETQKQTAVQSIKDFAQKIGLSVTDDEVAAFIAEAENDPYAVELRNEVPFLKADGMLKVWQLRNLDTIMKQTDLQAETRGRTQAAKDLDEMGKKSKNRSTPSTAGLSGNRQDPPKVDLDNPDEVESMDDAALFQRK